MKNFKTTYWILPLLAANLSMGPEMIRGWESASLSSTGKCDPIAEINRKGSFSKDTRLLTASCDFSSKTQIVVGSGKDQEKHSVTGRLTVERIEEVVEVKRGRAFDIDSVNKNSDANTERVEKVERVTYRATLNFSSDAGIEIDPVVQNYSSDQKGMIVSQMQSSFANGIAKMQKQAKQEVADQKAEQKLEAEIKACVKSDDGSKGGKVNSLAEKMECHKDQLIGLTGKEAESYYNKNMKTPLESLVFRGNAEDREEAQAILESMNKGYVPSIVKNSVSALTKSVSYQNKIAELATQVQLASQGPQDENSKRAKSVAQMQIQGLKSQMLSDFRAETANNSSFGLGRLGVYGSTSDVSRYQQLLDNNMKLAFLTPDKFFELQSSGAQTGASQYEIDPTGRLQRGGANMPIAGLPNVNNPQQAPYGPRQMGPQGYGPQSMGQRQVMPQQYGQRPMMGPQQSPMMYNNNGYVPSPVMRTGGVRY